MLSICIIYIWMSSYIHHIPLKTVLAWIRTVDLWVSNGGFDNCMLLYNATKFFGQIMM